METETPGTQDPELVPEETGTLPEVPPTANRRRRRHYASLILRGRDLAGTDGARSLPSTGSPRSTLGYG